ncbi:peptide-binding protein [Fundidesulfovibrio butyratiphilus]
MDFSSQGKPFANKTRSFRVIALACLLCGLFLLGCSRREDDSTPKSAPASASAREETPVSGGRIVMATMGEPSNLIPPLATDSASHEVADLLYVSPLRYDKNIRIEPYAAESFQVLDEGRHLKFTLRKDIHWYDGTPLTSADVEFTYKLMIDPKTPTAYAGDYQVIKEFRVTGPYTFEVFYEKPFARALSTWTSSILPKHSLEGQDLTNTPLARNPMGCGPYKLKQWVENQRVILEANPDYFEGRPYIDEVVYRSVPDQSTQFMELKAKTLDMMGLSPPQYLYLTNGPVWERDWRKYKYLSASYTYLGYNVSHPLFSDRRVRQALAYAVDKAEIVKGALMGLGVPTIGHYKPDSWAYNHDIEDYPHDPGRALMLLAQAGWTRKSPTGPLEKDGRPFAFTILTNQGNEQRIKTAAILQNQLARIGIQVKVRTVEWATFIKEFIDQRRFETVLLGWSIPQDPDAFDVWHSSKIEKPGLNFVGYVNPEVDALLEQGRNMVDPVKRKPLYDRFQVLLHEDQPYLFLYTPYALPILSARIHGVEPAPAGISWNFNRWWIPRDQQQSALTQ